MRCGERLLLSFLLCSILSICCSPLQAAEVFDTFLEPYQAIDISSPFRDRLSVIHVQDGDEIKKNQVLAELSTNVLLTRKKQAKEAASFKGAVNSANALVSMRKNRLHLLKELDAQGNVRPQELINAKTDLSMALAQLQESKEAKLLRQLDLDVIEAQLEEKKLRSPIDGMVVKLYKQEAELIGGNDELPLMTIVQLDPLAAVFHLPPSYTHGLAKGQEVPLHIAEITVTGKVEFISPIIDPQSGTMRVKVSVANPEKQLTSGSRCTLQIDSDG